MPRLWNHFLAWFLGYFWLPCPICGDYLGGHEGVYQALMVSATAGKIVCLKPLCVAESKRLNHLQGFDIHLYD